MAIPMEMKEMLALLELRFIKQLMKGRIISPS
jgi:hypothetical protein